MTGGILIKQKPHGKRFFEDVVVDVLEKRFHVVVKFPRTVC